MFNKICLTLLLLTAALSAAEITVSIETEKPDYRIGQTVNWTIKAQASTGDNHGINSLAVSLSEDQGETINIPFMAGNEYQGTDFGAAEGYTNVPVLKQNNSSLTTISAYQIQIVPDIGNDGIEKVLAQGSYTVNSLGTHGLDLSYQGAMYWPSTSSLQGVFFESSVVNDTAFGVFHRADINYDGSVDMSDFAILSTQWMQTGADLQADIVPADGDGVVDIDDLALLAEEWMITEL